MTKRMIPATMAIALASALTVSALIASNMGFKLNFPLEQASVGVSVQGENTLALPDIRPTGLNTAKDLMDDIGSANVLAISTYLKATSSFLAYTGRKNSPSPNFPLTAGEGNWVKMLTTTGYVIAGSDNSALPYVLTEQCGFPCDGTNFFAYNYHQTAATSKALMDDIGSASVLVISRYVKVTNSYQTYTGRKNSPSADFALVPGQAYYVKMLTTVNYIPSHY